MLLHCGRINVYDDGIIKFIRLGHSGNVVYGVDLVVAHDSVTTDALDLIHPNEKAQKTRLIAKNDIYKIKEKCKESLCGKYKVTTRHKLHLPDESSREYRVIKVETRVPSFPLHHPLPSPPLPQTRKAWTAKAYRNHYLHHHSKQVTFNTFDTLSVCSIQAVTAPPTKHMMRYTKEGKLKMLSPKKQPKNPPLSSFAPHQLSPEVNQTTISNKKREREREREVDKTYVTKTQDPT